MEKQREVAAAGEPKEVAASRQRLRQDTGRI